MYGFHKLLASSSHLHTIIPPVNRIDQNRLKWILNVEIETVEVSVHKETIGFSLVFANFVITIFGWSAHLG